MNQSSAERLMETLQTEAGQAALKAIRSSITIAGNEMELPGAFKAYRADSPELSGIPGFEHRATNWIVSPENDPTHYTSVKGATPDESKQKTLNFIARMAMAQGYTPSVAG